MNTFQKYIAHSKFMSVNALTNGNKLDIIAKFYWYIRYGTMVISCISGQCHSDNKVWVF